MKARTQLRDTTPIMIEEEDAEEIKMSEEIIAKEKAHIVELKERSKMMHRIRNAFAK